MFLYISASVYLVRPLPPDLPEQPVSQDLQIVCNTQAAHLPHPRRERRLLVNIFPSQDEDGKEYLDAKFLILNPRQSFAIPRGILKMELD